MILADTNILCRLAQKTHPHYPIAAEAIRKLTAEKLETITCSQSLYEYYFVLTKPATHNGFGYSAEKASHELKNTCELFGVLHETSETFQVWHDLITRYKITNRPIFDARLVAIMMEHKVNRILTFNDQDFRFFSEISVINPFDYLNIPRVP